MLNAIILAGGLGTRLSQTISHLPKALAPIQGIPFLQLLFQQLENSRLLSKVILALGHKAANIQQFLRTQNYSFSIAFSIESSPLGTGGALLYALNKTDGETFFVLNGDSYFDLSLSDFLAFHQAKKADITIACREVPDTSRYGAVEMAPSQRITSFREKSDRSQSGWISAGIYLIQRQLLSFPPGVHSIENDFFPRFLEKNIFAYPHNGSFIDIGTPNSYNEAQEILKPWISA